MLVVPECQRHTTATIARKWTANSACSGSSAEWKSGPITTDGVTYVEHLHQSFREGQEWREFKRCLEAMNHDKYQFLLLREIRKSGERKYLLWGEEMLKGWIWGWYSNGIVNGICLADIWMWIWGSEGHYHDGHKKSKNCWTDAWNCLLNS